MAEIPKKVIANSMAQNSKKMWSLWLKFLKRRSLWLKFLKKVVAMAKQHQHTSAAMSTH